MRVYILQSTGNKWLISIIVHWKLGFYTQACFLSSVRQVIGRQQVDIWRHPYRKTSIGVDVQIPIVDIRRFRCPSDVQSSTTDDRSRVSRTSFITAGLHDILLGMLFHFLCGLGPFWILLVTYLINLWYFLLLNKFDVISFVVIYFLECVIYTPYTPTFASLMIPCQYGGPWEACQTSFGPLKGSWPTS